MKEYAPVPEKTLDEPGNSFGDTLLLLDMVREKTVRENRKKKVRKVFLTPDGCLANWSQKSHRKITERPLKSE